LNMLFCLLLPSYKFFNTACQQCSSYLDMQKKSCCLKLQSRSKSRMPVQSIHMHVTYNTEKVHEWSLPCHLQYQKNTRMIFPQVHLRKHLREFSFLWVIRFTRLSTAMSAPEHSGSDPLKVSPWVL
jgi:hypothetical protein